MRLRGVAICCRPFRAIGCNPCIVGGLAATEEDLVRWDYESARLDVVREVGRAFVTVLAAQERLALAERMLELSRQAQSAAA